jgi:hypothetical protein
LPDIFFAASTPLWMSCTDAQEVKVAAIRMRQEHSEAGTQRILAGYAWFGAF